MSSKRIQFNNGQGEQLSARLETPDFMEAHSYALFAHCFTCNKNFSAVRNISRALNDVGIAVLRFDFTGLGDSEGEFEDTNFSSNVGDLIAAAKFLEENYQAPSLLIGHSLGGAAVIFAAAELDGVKAVATIGAPSSPEHVAHLFSQGLDQINEQEEAEVSIGGRPFKVKQQFVEDLKNKNLPEVVKSLRRGLAIFHSPQDDIVGIQNAQKIYSAAHHPKSFISLDGADHLLTKKKDSVYVGHVIAGWAERYLDVPEPEEVKTNHQVAVSIGNEGFTSEVIAGKHQFIADEPESYGGNDFGPSPYELVSSGLGACTTMTLRMYADRKKWDLQKVVVHINHGKEYMDDQASEGKPSKKIDQFIREIELHGNLTEEQEQRLLEIADKCPVHKTLHAPVQVITTLKK